MTHLLNRLRMLVASIAQHSKNSQLLKQYLRNMLPACERSLSLRAGNNMSSHSLLTSRALTLVGAYQSTIFTGYVCSSW